VVLDVEAGRAPGGQTAVEEAHVVHASVEHGHGRARGAHHGVAVEDDRRRARDAEALEDRLELRRRGRSARGAGVDEVRVQVDGARHVARR
jgi:hypothetical protein